MGKLLKTLGLTLLVALMAGPSSAAVLYTYTSASVLSTEPGIGHIAGGATIGTAPSGLGLLTFSMTSDLELNRAFGRVTPSSWSISDGVHTYSSSVSRPNPGQDFAFATDSLGAITEWIVDVWSYEDATCDSLCAYWLQDYVLLRTHNSPEAIPGQLTAFDVSNLCSAVSCDYGRPEDYNAQSAVAPGTWSTKEVDDPLGVPEPATLALVGAALLGAVTIRRRNPSMKGRAIRVASRLRPLAVLLFVAGVLGATSNASAALIAASDSSFSWTIDTATGLDWLDFDGGPAPSTNQRPYDEVAAELGTGGDYEGWRFAKPAELYTFILHVTGLPYLFAAPNTWSGQDGATDAVAALTGYTRQAGSLDIVLGFVGDRYSDGVSYGGLFDYYPQPNQVSEYTIWIYPSGSIVDTSGVYEDLGSWLVRGDGGSSAAPEPATLALVSAAIAGTLVTRRRKPPAPTV